MDKNNKIGLRVVFKGELYDENMNLKSVTYKHNTLMNGGYDFICNALGSSNRPAAMEYVAIGKGTTANSPSMTALVSQLAIVKGTYSHTNGTKFFTLKAVFAPGTGTGTINELAVFNALSGGTMLDRIVIGTVTKAAGDTYNATFQFAFEEVE